MSDKNINFKASESMSVDEEKISQLLGSLNRIEAPKDFEFRVRARIAAGRPEGIPGYRLPAAIRFAVPLAAVLAVGAYFGISSYYSVDNAAIPAVAEKQTPVLPAANPDQPINPQVVVPAPPAIEQQNTVASKDERVITKAPDTVVNPPKSIVTNTNVVRSTDIKDKAPGGGSIDMSGVSKNVITLPPKTVNNNQQNQHLRPANSLPPVSANTVLEMLGINAKFEGNGWRVTGLRSQGMAERSGLKVGDIVEGINNQRMDDKSTYGNQFNGRSLRVIRNGKPMQIELKP